MLFENLSEGQTRKKTFVITPAVYDGFVACFGDRNPLHIDKDYAASKGFAGKVMHGAIVSGFISTFIGMEFPGAGSLIQSVRVEYKSPSFLNDALSLEAVVEQKIDAVRTVVLKMTVQNETQKRLSAVARVQVGLP